MKSILLNGKHGKNKFALVDDDKYPELVKYRWHCSHTGYARRTVVHTNSDKSKKYECIFMHKCLLNAPDKKFIDHKNRNTLDNRIENLRICTPQENSRNRAVSIVNPSGYKGVFYRKDRNIYYSMIQINGKQKYLGYFKKAIRAAKAYNDAAIKYYKEFAFLNII